MKKTLYIIVGILILLQFIPAKIENPPIDRSLEIQAPAEVMSVFKRSCYDCHSNEVKLPWYSKVAPASFFVKSHVDLGRKWLNFSTWKSYTEEEKEKKLKGIFRTVYAAMPLASYIAMHEDAKLSKEEIHLLREWTGKAPF